MPRIHIWNFVTGQATSDAPLKGTNQTRQEQELEWQWIQTTNVTWCHFMSLDVACYLILAEHVSSPQIMFHDVSVQGGWLLYFLDGFPRDVLRGNAPHQCWMMPFKLGKNDVEVQQPHAQTRGIEWQTELIPHNDARLQTDQLRAAELQKMVFSSFTTGLGEFILHIFSWASCPLLYTVRQKMVHVHFEKSQCWVLSLRYFKDMCAPQYTINLCPPALLSALRRCLFSNQPSRGKGFWLFLVADFGC